MQRQFGGKKIFDRHYIAANMIRQKISFKKNKIPVVVEKEKIK